MALATELPARRILPSGRIFEATEAINIGLANAQVESEEDTLDSTGKSRIDRKFEDSRQFSADAANQ